MLGSFVLFEVSKPELLVTRAATSQGVVRN